MQTQTQPGSQLERRIDIAFSLASVDTEVQSRLRQIARTARIHGFRPGKVPMTVVARQYGGQVRQEVVADSVQQRFTEAVKAQNYRVAGMPRFDPKPIEGDADEVAFTATFEIYPSLEVNALTGSTIKRPVTAVLDEDVDATIDILRKQRAQFETVQRPSQSGDRVELDFRGTVDGEAFEGGSGSGFRVVLGEGAVVKDFEDGLIGVSAGESKTFPVVFPDTYQAANLAGKTAEFSVDVKEVAQVKLPEVDEAFARQLGIGDGSVEKMREEIRGNLEREVKKRVTSRVKDAVMEELLARNPIEVPNSLVEMEIQRLRETALEDLSRRGVADKDITLPDEMFADQARRRVALGLLLAELVRREKLEARPDQVRAILEEHAQSYEQPAEMVNWYYQDPSRLREVEALVVEDNVVNWLLDGAHVEEVPTMFKELMGRSNVA